MVRTITAAEINNNRYLIDEKYREYRRLKSHEYYQQNKERMKALSKEYHKRHRNKYREYMRNYMKTYHENPDEERGIVIIREERTITFK